MREKCVEDVGYAWAHPQGEVYSFLPSLCHLLCFLLWALMLWMTSSCSLCCFPPAGSRLASEFWPNLSSSSLLNKSACPSVLGYTPIFFSQIQGFLFCPCVFLQHFPVSRHLLQILHCQVFWALLMISSAVWIRDVNHGLVQMIVTGPAKCLVAFPVQWCKAEKSQVFSWVIVDFLLF